MATIITTWAQLDDVRNHLSTDYELGNNLTSASTGYSTYAASTSNTNTGWLPIGSTATPYTGTFDGKGFIIQDVVIRRNGADQGLFGAVTGTVKNVTMRAVDYSTVQGTLVFSDTFTGSAAAWTLSGGAAYNSNNVTLGGGTMYTTADVLTPSTQYNLFVKLTGSKVVISYGTADGLGSSSGSNMRSTGSNDIVFRGFSANYAKLRMSGATITVDDVKVYAIIGGISAYGALVGSLLTGGVVQHCFSTGTISDPTTDGSYFGGLIGYVTAGTVSDSGSSVAITGSPFGAGGFMGGADTGATITNCFARGNVQGNGATGGFIGYFKGDATHASTISKCFSTGNVSGGDSNGVVGLAFYCGGFVGEFDCGTSGSSNITDSYSTGTVTFTTVDQVGGFVGTLGFAAFITAPFCYVKRCYATGSVTGWTKTGGFVGTNSSQVYDCYATGNVTINTSDVGGFMGRGGGGFYRCWSQGTVTGTSNKNGFGFIDVAGNGLFKEAIDCFWDTTISAQASSNAGTGKTTAQMQVTSLYSGAATLPWDIKDGYTNDSVWGRMNSENGGKPFLQATKTKGGNFLQTFRF